MEQVVQKSTRQLICYVNVNKIENCNKIDFQSNSAPIRANNPPIAIFNKLLKYDLKQDHGPAISLLAVGSLLVK